MATLCVDMTATINCQHTLWPHWSNCALFFWDELIRLPLPPTHTPRSASAGVCIAFSFFLHSDTYKPRAQWSFSICMRFWIIYVLYCLIELCQVSLCAHLFLKPTKRASDQESEWESGGERGSKRSKLALVKLQRVVISVAFYLCFVCCCCCCLSAVCVGECVRLPVCVCVEPTLSDSERSTTTTTKWHSAAISCAVVVVAVGDRDCLIMMAQYTHTHIHTCVYVCTACVFLINRRKYKKLN